MAIAHCLKVKNKLKQSNPFSFKILSLAILVLSSCSRQLVQVADVPAFDSLKDMSTAPEPIKTAAQGVINLNSRGTGFFVSSDGVVMTNAHVARGLDCPIEGCFIDIGINYQRGVTGVWTPVFAKILEIHDEPEDVATIQIYDLDQSTLYKSLHTLKIVSQSSTDLLKKTLFVVGHPAGALKKWISGDIFEVDQNHIMIDALVINGNSGSPMLDDAGNVVGIIHRSSLNYRMLTREDFENYGIGTPSKNLLERLQNKEEAGVIKFSLNGENINKNLTSLKEINAQNFEIMLSYVRSSGTMPDLLDPLDQTKPISAYELTKRNCMEGFKNLQEGLGSQASTVKSCQSHMSFVQCRGEKKSTHYDCPDEAGKTELLAILDELDRIGMQSFGHLRGLISSFSSNRSGLGWSAEAIQTAGIKLLNEQESEVNPLSARWVAFWGMHNKLTLFQGQDMLVYLAGYKAIPDVGRHYYDVVKGNFYGHKMNRLKKEDLSQMITNILAEKDIQLSDFFAIEEFAYQRGFIN